MMMPEFIENGNEMHSLTALRQESTDEKLASLAVFSDKDNRERLCAYTERGGANMPSRRSTAVTLTASEGETELQNHFLRNRQDAIYRTRKSAK
jgi:hypothetical protein